MNEWRRPSTALHIDSRRKKPNFYYTWNHLLLTYNDIIFSNNIYLQINVTAMALYMGLQNGNILIEQCFLRLYIASPLLHKNIRRDILGQDKGL